HTRLYPYIIPFCKQEGGYIIELIDDGLAATQLPVRRKFTVLVFHKIIFEQNFFPRYKIIVLVCFETGRSGRGRWRLAWLITFIVFIRFLVGLISFGSIFHFIQSLVDGLVSFLIGTLVYFVFDLF